MRGVKPPIPVLLDAVPDDVVECRRDVPPRLRQLRRILLQDRRDRVARRVPLERPLAREHLVQDRSEREDVRAVIHGQAAHLLGRHVAHRAHHRPRLRVARARRRVRLLLRSNGLRLLRQPEVQDLDVAVLRDEQVVRLQIPVDDPLLVGGGEALDHLQCVVDGLSLRDRTRVELASQRLALQQLRHRVGRPVLGSEIVNGQDVRMRQRRNRLGFALEARQCVRILRHRVREAP